MALNRRERARQDTSQEILATARAQIAEKGAAGLSLRGVARRMGLTAPALYRYFENRDALVTTLIVTGYQSLQTHLSTLRDEHSQQSYKEQLLAIGRGYRLWGLAHPEDFALIFGTPIPGYQAPPENTIPLASSSLGVLISVIKDGVDASEFTLPNASARLSEQLENDPSESKPDPALIHAALALWGHVHGLTSLELFNHLQLFLEDPDEFFEIELHTKINTLMIKD